MKIKMKMPPEMVTVNYFGLVLTMERGTWLSMDENGDICEMASKPIAGAFGNWLGYINHLIMRVDPTGIDWEATLGEVDKLPVVASA